jgi:hypothetical protein
MSRHIQLQNETRLICMSDHVSEERVARAHMRKLLSSLIHRIGTLRAFLFVSIGCFIYVTGSAAEPTKSIYEAAACSRLEALATNQPNVQFFQSLTNLPASVRGKLLDMADKGQPFSSGCVGSEPHRRFLAATKAGATYNVAYEQGGLVYTWLIVRFDVDESGKVVREARIETIDPTSRSGR